MAYEVAAIRSLEDVPILDAVLKTGDLQDRRVVVLSSDGGPPWLAQGV